MIVSQVLEAPPDVVWEVFTDLPSRVRCLSEVDSVDVIVLHSERIRWRERRQTRDALSSEMVIEDLVLTVAEPGRRCTVALADDGLSNQLTYEFTLIDLGPHRWLRSAGPVSVGHKSDRPRPDAHRRRVLCLAGGW